MESTVPARQPGNYKTRTTIVTICSLEWIEQTWRRIYQICGGDFSDKVHLLLDYTNRPGDIADPWYTEDFDTAWKDIEEGCRGLLSLLTSE